MMDSRGQVFSGEFLLAYFIFLTVMILAVLLWHNTERDITEAETLRLLEEKSVEASEQLVRTRGVPADWSASNVLSVGLAEESRILSEDKISEFTDLMSDARYDSLCNDVALSNYACSRHLLGLSGFDFAYELNYLNDSPVTVYGKTAETGKQPVNQTRLITVERTALLDNETVRATLTVWYTSGEEHM
ncbi:MAG: hypothetical protein ABH834_01945 [Candidatus Altiarchaeota archaeon]